MIELVNSFSITLRSRKQSDFLCHIKYRNRIPEPPIESKLLPIFQERDSLTSFCASTLDETYRWDMNLEPEALVSAVDFVDPDSLGARFNPGSNSSSDHHHDQRVVSTLHGASLVAGPHGLFHVASQRSAGSLANAQVAAQRQALYNTSSTMFRRDISIFAAESSAFPPKKV